MRVGAKQDKMVLEENQSTQIHDLRKVELESTCLITFQLDGCNLVNDP